MTKEVKNGLIIEENGDKRWYKDNELHRENDLPAIEYANGSKGWYINGKLHRENGPAIEYKNKDKLWSKNGKPHRIDGPAVERYNGNHEYWINGSKKTKEAFVHYVNMQRLNKELSEKLEINPIISKPIKI